jgi:MotA/TolQ/ExbB proton channel family
MPFIPSYLIFFTVVLVILPSIAAIFSRLSLYQHLVGEADKVKMLIGGNKSVTEPQTVKNIKSRFKQASIQLDNVNTAALIDQFYSQEKIKLHLLFFTKEVSCDQIDYLCRILPNLLLAFGLFGTFFGITRSLLALSQTINQTTASNVTSLVAELEKPLQGMSIAFITSLTGLFFSVVLTGFNWLKNTSQAKYRLISSLEDYLDNIYQPTIDGHTRLDKAVDRMANLQNEFLTNFGNNVRDVLEQSLGKVAKEIAEENKKANELAKQVYEGFTVSSGTISAAATNFKIAGEELKAKSQIFKQAAETFEKSQFPQRLSDATADLANTQEKFSQSAASLAQTVISIATAVSEVQRLGEEIRSVNQTSVKVLELHQSNQNSLSEIIPQLKQGASNLGRVTKQLDNLEEKIANKADSFNGVEVTLTELVGMLRSYTEGVNLGIESLGDRFVLNLSEQLDINNQQFHTVVSNLEGYANKLNVQIDTLKLDLMELLKDNNAKTTSEYKKVSVRLLGGIKETTEYNIYNIKNYQKLGTTIQESVQQCIQQLSNIKEELSQIKKI